VAGCPPLTPPATHTARRPNRVQRQISQVKINYLDATSLKLRQKALIQVGETHSLNKLGTSSIVQEGKMV